MDYTTYEAFFGAFPEPVLLVSGQKLIYCNAAAAHLFALDPLTPDTSVPGALSALLPDSPCAFTLTDCMFSGSCFSISGTMQPDGLLLVFRLQARSAPLSREFLSALSDQLRTPLNSLLAAATLLAPIVEGNPQYEKLFSIVTKYHYRLLRMIGSLTSAQQLFRDDPAESAPLANTDVIPLINYLCNAADDLAGTMDRHILFERDRQQLIMAVHTDSFSQMLLNLISNALKFSPKNSTVYVRAERRDDRLLLSVRDEGDGFHAEDLATAFSRYEVDTSLNPHPKGLGLGLALVRQIAQQHGGSVLLESRAKEGTTVTVALPVRRLPDETLHSYRPAVDTYGGFNIVLVELSDVLPAEVFLPKDMA